MSEQSCRSILNELGKVSETDQGYRLDNEGGGGATSSGPERMLIGQITGVINIGQPVYDAEAIDNSAITVTNQTPFWRNLDATVEIVPASIGDECVLFKDADDTWRLGLAHEFMATEDCQAVAASRNNMTVEFVTSSQSVQVSSDWLKVDTSAGPVTLTFDEFEVGKRFLVTKADSSANPIIISNVVNGVAGLQITVQYDSADFGFDGTEWSIN
jgi:hypothetical protein